MTNIARIEIPQNVDYTVMPVGKNIRMPKGTISICPKCRKPGLELIYSNRRGRYEVAYWHLALKDFTNMPPRLVSGCSIVTSSKNALNKLRARAGGNNKKGL